MSEPVTDSGDSSQKKRRRLPRALAGLRFTSLRLRLVVVFALVALTAAVSASGIAYWLNREAVLTRTQDAALKDFQQAMQDRVASLPQRPTMDELDRAARNMTHGSQDYSVLLIGTNPDGKPVVGNSELDAFTLDDVPKSLRKAVDKPQEVNSGNGPARTAQPEYRLFWQRRVIDGTPYLVGGTRVMGGGPTGYMLKSLEAEAKDLNSLAWSLGIATALALVGAALLAQAAATTVLKPVHRLGVAARRLGEGELDTRLRVSGTDELAELSRTFNATAASLEKKVADMSAREESSRRFVADMSHELRTPLTAITAVTEVLEEEEDTLDPMIAPAVKLVVSETRRLNDLVENLMEVTRFDAGTARLVLDDVDIADQITACIDARAWLDAVELDAERGLRARLDPRRLDVVLANLIGNALKHGGSPVRVSVRESEDGTDGTDGTDGAHGTELIIRVRDHGPGIPEEVLPHVFDRFYKASASRPRSEGSGLGLSIAMENAHIHGGEITAANSPEGGAVFTLRLPRDASHMVERPAEEGEQREQQGGGSGSRSGDSGGSKGDGPREDGTEEGASR
ncbi:ATP-binding protein [Streptomyces sp. NPDC002851]